MDFALAPKYLELQAQARALADAVEPVAAEADEYNTVHPAVLSALQASGLTELMVPAEYGGRDDQPDPLAICLVREVLMATSAHLDSLFAMQGIGSYAISVGGSPEQRDRWLPSVAKAEALAGLALTEPNAGSDLKAVTTELTASGEGFLLSGEKSFISNGGAAAFYIVFAKEGSDYSMVLVPADAEGVSVTPTPQIMAPHILGEVHLANVQLPATARLEFPVGSWVGSHTAPSAKTNASAATTAP